MDFLSFYRIGSSVLSLPGTFSSKIYQRFASKHEQKAIVSVLVLKYCYSQIIDMKKKTVCMNDYLLDFETATNTCQSADVIIVKGKKRETFCFTLQEILSIYKSDLCRSVLVYDNILRVYTVMKNFRLPRNPYSNEIFSIDETRQIISQIVLKTSDLPREFYDVYVFLQYFENIFSVCMTKEPYEVTNNLHTFFEKHGFRFVERYIKKNDENQSHWKYVEQKSVMKNMYDWFILNVFLPLT
jgi:hypothetical protein